MSHVPRCREKDKSEENWVRDVPYEWGMSQMNIMYHMDESHMNIMYVPYEYMGHVPYE